MNNGADAFKELLEQRRAQLQGREGATSLPTIQSSLPYAPTSSNPYSYQFPTSSVTALATHNAQQNQSYIHPYVLQQQQQQQLQQQVGIYQYPLQPAAYYPRPTTPFPIPLPPNFQPPMMHSFSGYQQLHPSTPHYPQFPQFPPQFPLLANPAALPPPPQKQSFQQSHRKQQQRNHQLQQQLQRNQSTEKSKQTQKKAAGGQSQQSQPQSPSQLHQILPSEQEYYCEPCDKSFKKIFDYDAHCKTHEKCSHPECAFVGSKKVVIAHYHSRHGQYAGDGYKIVDVEGQRFNLLLGYSAEEIEKWKRERRLKFPTKERLKQKAEQIQAIQDTGGIPLKADRTDRIKERVKKRKRGSDGVHPHQQNQLKSDGSKNDSGDTKQAPNKRQRQLIVPPPLDGGKRGTLLKKLLEDQIVEEENLILQCIQYVCQSNFFLDSSGDKPPETTFNEQIKQDFSDYNQGPSSGGEMSQGDSDEEQDIEVDVKDESEKETEDELEEQGSLQDNGEENKYEL